MKIDQIIRESSVGGTVSGGISSVAKPMGTVNKRLENVEVKGLSPVSAPKKKKGPYVNSITEGKMKEKDIEFQDYKNMSLAEFKKAYGMTKKEWHEKNKKLVEPNKSVSEGELQEDDLILIPGKGMRRKSGLIPRDMDKGESEGETLKNSLHTIIRVATHLNDRLSTQDNFPEWVSEKVGAVKSMMVSVMDYIISDQEMNDSALEATPGGVIAGGGVGENKLTEKFKSKQQAKLMYAVAGDEDVAKKTGVSQKVAKEFIKKSHGQKVSKLPKKVEKKKD